MKGFLFNHNGDWDSDVFDFHVVGRPTPPPTHGVHLSPTTAGHAVDGDQVLVPGCHVLFAGVRSDESNGGVC